MEIGKCLLSSVTIALAAALLSAAPAIAAPKKINVEIVNVTSPGSLSDQQITEAFSRLSERLDRVTSLKMIEFGKWLESSHGQLLMPSEKRERCRMTAQRFADSLRRHPRRLFIVFLSPTVEYDLTLISSCRPKPARLVIIAAGAEQRPGYAKILDPILLRAVKRALTPRSSGGNKL